MLLSDAPEGLGEAGWATAACGILMAIWWATEAVPIAVTALLPLVAFPLLGITTIQNTAAPYANKVIFLFLGGFIVAYTMQRWNLHRRIALNVLQKFWQQREISCCWVYVCQCRYQHVGHEHVDHHDVAADRRFNHYSHSQVGTYIWTAKRATTSSTRCYWQLLMARR